MKNWRAGVTQSRDIAAQRYGGYSRLIYGPASNGSIHLPARVNDSIDETWVPPPRSGPWQAERKLLSPVEASPLIFGEF
jgi:hypothetical protein